MYLYLVRSMCVDFPLIGPHVPGATPRLGNQANIGWWDSAASLAFAFECSRLERFED